VCWYIFEFTINTDKMHKLLFESQSAYPPPAISSKRYKHDTLTVAMMRTFTSFMHEKKETLQKITLDPVYDDAIEDVIYRTAGEYKEGEPLVRRGSRTSTHSNPTYDSPLVRGRAGSADIEQSMVDQAIEESLQASVNRPRSDSINGIM
jgi:hypothetical protein